MKNIILYFLINIAFAKKIVNLPGLDFQIYSDQHSGYLNVSKTHRLFYWFLESQNTPSADPLVFWFNGGPGCSSLFGLVWENGPFILTRGNGTFRRNIYSLNRNANVVYLESPAGVGFSYSTDGIISTHDDLTADEKYVAIQQFFKEFPQFRNHDVFLTGESYAGVYIPMLASRIIDGQKDFPVKLKGIAIGNGAMSEISVRRTTFLFGASHGLLSNSFYRDRVDQCCNGKLETCIPDMNDQSCRIVFDFSNFYRNKGIDSYDISRKCHYSEDKNDTSLISCILDFHLTLESYFNSASVKEALHIPDKNVTWKACTGQYNYTKTKVEMKDYIQKVVKNNIRVLLFYGDQDKVCDFLTGQRFVASLKLEKLAPKTPWYYNNILAGYKTLYKGLTLTTIRGAGHFAPQSHPVIVFHIFQQFLNNRQI